MYDNCPIDVANKAQWLLHGMINWKVSNGITYNGNALAMWRHSVFRHPGRPKPNNDLKLKLYFFADRYSVSRICSSSVLLQLKHGIRQPPYTPMQC